MKSLSKTLSYSLSSTVTAAVLLAYSDCHGSETEMNRGMSTRNLNFRANESVSRDEAVAIMREAVSHGYNEFKADLIKKLPAESRITIAREGSVCLYVEGNVKEIKGMKADEWDFDPAKNESRLWWD